ncbi:MAG: histidine kinase dimerization/phosphoacceptor domain -containing protein [Desulfatirhabdiaceae bacterium]
MTVKKTTDDELENRIIHLESELARRDRFEKISRALFKISDVVNTTESLDGLFRSIHAILGSIMDTTNFCIALYDQTKDAITFSYGVDMVDNGYPTMTDINRMESPVAAVIRTGNPFMIGKTEMLARNASSDLNISGYTPPEIWLGVPLKIHDENIGIMAVKSYHDPMCYDQTDMDVLVSVANQAALVVERKLISLNFVKNGARLRKTPGDPQEKELLIKDSIIRHSSSAIAACDLEGNMIYANPCFLKLWGFNDLEEFLNKPFWNYWLLDDQYEQIMNSLLVNGIWAGEIRAARKDGTLFDVQVSAAMVFDDTDKPFALTSTSIDITAHKRAEEELRESEAHYIALFNNINSGVAIYRPVDDGKDFICINLNAAAEKINRITNKELIGKRLLEKFPEMATSDLFGAFQKVNFTGSALELPELYYKDAYREGWQKNFIYKLVSGEIVSIYDDITERKQSENALRSALEEKIVLLREVHHRVKNNLQVICSLLSLQSGMEKNKQIQQALIESQQRIFAMSMIHEALYSSQNFSVINFSAYFMNLVNRLREIYRDQTEVQIDLDLDKIELGIDQAVPCGLIINELITNAFKHAFPGKSKGMIQVKGHVTNHREVILTVSDNGVGLAIDMTTDHHASLGLRLIQSLLTRQLKGSLDVVVEGGTTFILRWPL